MLKSRFGKLGASLIYCSEGERERVGVRERKRDREERERERERETYLSAFTLKQNYITFKGFNQEPILCKPDWVHIQIIIESVSVVYNLSAMTSERNI